jgi:hypothetical protein
VLRDERLDVDALGKRYGVELFALEKVAAWPLCEELFSLIIKMEYFREKETYEGPW